MSPGFLTEQLWTPKEGCGVLSLEPTEWYAPLLLYIGDPIYIIYYL